MQAAVTTSDRWACVKCGELRQGRMATMMLRKDGSLCGNCRRIEAEAQGVYEVEKVVGHRSRAVANGGGLEFCVRWRGYRQEHDT